MARLVKGNELSLELQRAVLSRYVHRHHSGLPDSQWLAEHAFYVTEDGRLDERYCHCEPAYLAGHE
jgi:hypothetical protein